MAKYTTDFANGMDVDPDESKYELKAIIIHRGGAYGGHYLAYIKDDCNEGNWDLHMPEEFQAQPDELLKTAQDATTKAKEENPGKNDEKSVNITQEPEKPKKEESNTVVDPEQDAILAAQLAQDFGGDFGGMDIDIEEQKRMYESMYGGQTAAEVETPKEEEKPREEEKPQEEKKPQ